MRTKLDKEGRVLLPSKLRKGLNINPGDELEIEEFTQQTLTITKVGNICRICGRKDFVHQVPNTKINLCMECNNKLKSNLI